MNLIFERGDRDAPVGHALIYFRSDKGAIVATYFSVPPIQFDPTSYLPPAMKGMFEGMFEGIPEGEAMVFLPPMPPIPEEVESVEYLHALASRRQDDLVYGGGTMALRAPQDAQEAAQSYAELYAASAVPEQTLAAAAPTELETDRLSQMSESEQLHELTNLTGRLRDSLRNGSPDPDIERQMRRLAAALPAKYRADALVDAALTPGEKGQRLAELYLERSYKLYNEEYLDLERIDREIEAVAD